MATYAIGDLQGCSKAFEALLGAIRFDPSRDRLWLVGDLVNRGPDSLGTLRRVISLGDAARVVLGNHDFHLMAVACGVQRVGAADTLADILGAPDVEALLAWLRRQPLAYAERIGAEQFVMVHAGILPHWSLEDALRRAAEVESLLRGPSWRTLFEHLYGDTPTLWNDALTGHERLRMIVNSFTRLRFCDSEGRLDLETKEGAGHAPKGFYPWFDVPKRQAAETTIVFGHWSTLGLLNRAHLIGTDTGCVWGGALTAVRLEDRTLTQVACHQSRIPG